MKSNSRILLLFVIFCLASQTTNLLAKESYNNKILDWYSLNFILVDSLDKKQVNEENNDENRVSPIVIIDVFQSIPTPLEVAVLIKNLGTDYHKDNLSNSDSVDNYTTDYKKALNLGIYSTDLGYANLYQQNEDKVNYLNATKKLVDGLNIGQFLDFPTIQKLAQASNDLDSLLQFSSHKFEQVTTELSNQKRQHLSILILTGGWLESVYITSLVYKDSRNEDLKSKIGEQKLILHQILLVLDVYKDEPNFQALIDKLALLQKIYNNVEIVEKDGVPRMEVKDGEIIIVDTREIVVTISEEDVEDIINLTASIRNQIISK